MKGKKSRAANGGDGPVPFNLGPGSNPFAKAIKAFKGKKPVVKWAKNRAHLKILDTFEFPLILQRPATGGANTNPVAITVPKGTIQVLPWIKDWALAFVDDLGNPVERPISAAAFNCDAVQKNKQWYIQCGAQLRDANDYTNWIAFMNVTGIALGR